MKPAFRSCRFGLLFVLALAQHLHTGLPCHTCMYCYLFGSRQTLFFDTEDLSPCCHLQPSLKDLSLSSLTAGLPSQVRLENDTTLVLRWSAGSGRARVSKTGAQSILLSRIRIRIWLLILNRHLIKQVAGSAEPCRHNSEVIRIQVQR